MKQSVGFLADGVFAAQAQGARGGAVDKGDGAGEIHAVDTFGSGLENQNEFPANSFALFFGNFASHELTQLVADANEKVMQRIVYDLSFVTEEHHDAEYSLRHAERYGKRSAYSRRNCGGNASEAVAFGYVLNRLRRACVPDTPRQT